MQKPAEAGSKFFGDGGWHRTEATSAPHRARLTLRSAADVITNFNYAIIACLSKPSSGFFHTVIHRQTSLCTTTIRFHLRDYRTPGV